MAAKYCKGDLRRTQARTPFQQYGPAREIGCSRSDMAPGGQGIGAGRQHASIPRRIFLNEDGVGARRDGRAGEDAQRFARRER